MFAAVHSLVWLIILAPGSWGQNLPPDFKSLAFSEKWLRLNHYEKSLWGYSSPFTRGFFLANDGAINPEAELLATVNSFKNPSPELVERLKMHPQCLYRARFRFLKPTLEKLGIKPVPCPQLEEWKKLLNAKSVSMIFASSDLSSATSSFGHLFLKLGNPDNVGKKELVDYGINYAADANTAEGVFYALKGLFGFYLGRFTMHPFHHKIREYTNMEGRDLWEYQLNFTPEQVDELVDHLLEMGPAQAPYYFFSDNCAYQIVLALEAVDLNLNVSEKLPSYVIPLDTLKLIARNPGAIQKTKFTRSLKSDFLDDYRKLNSREKEALEVTKTSLTVDPNYGLNPEQSGRVLEAAMKYFALKAYQSGRDLDAEKYKLSVQRSRLGAVTTEKAFTDPDPPDRAHDSKGVYVGAGEKFQQGRFQAAKFRIAFHDLEQADLGMVEFSHIEIGSLEVRHYNEDSRTVIERATLVNLLNTSPITSLDNYLSWRAHLSLRDRWRSDLTGGAGVSYSLGAKIRFTQLLNVRYLDPFLGAGPNFVLAVRASKRIGLSADAGYYFGEEGRSLWEFKLRGNLQIAKDWDVQAEFGHHADTMVRILYNFL